MTSTKELSDAFYEALNAHDVAKLGEQLSEDVTYWEANLPEPINGREAVQKHMAGNWESFPDSRVKLVNRIESGEWLADQMEWTGTNTGPIEIPGQPPIPATGKKATGSAVAIVRTAEGKITELRVYYDNLGMLAQIGLLTPPGSE